MKRYPAFILAAALLLAVGSSTPAASTATESDATSSGAQFAFPETRVGRAFREWLSVYNAADVEGLRAFHRANSPAGQVEGRTALDLLLRQQTGPIEPLSIVRSSEYELVLLGRSELTELWLEGLMELSPEPPHHVRGVGGRPVPPPGDHALGKAHTEDELRAELDRYLTKLTEAGVFSGAVLVAKDGRPLYAKGFGMADERARTPNGVETKFNLGSMNKMLTAVAIAQLVEQGKLSFDDPVGKHVSGLPREVAESVTIHHLLTHTSGVGDFFGPRFDPVKEELRSLRDYLPLFIDEPLHFAPGSDWAYSNGGFILLGLVVEAVSGQDYFDYVREHIYGPAGMTDSDSYDKNDAVPSLAVGYTHPLPPSPADLRPELVLGPRTENTATLPRMGSSAGGGYSTVLDLLSFAEALHSGALVSRAMAEHLMTGKVSLPFDESERYAYGFEDVRYLGTRITGHGGGFPGVSSKLEMYLDLGYTVAVLANVDGGAEPVVAKIRELLVRG